MGQYSISPALRDLYARQRELMGQTHLSAPEREELIRIDRAIPKAWDIERARQCRATHGEPRRLTTGPDPRDQAYGDR